MVATGGSTVSRALLLLDPKQARNIFNWLIFIISLGRFSTFVCRHSCANIVTGFLGTRADIYSEMTTFNAYEILI